VNGGAAKKQNADGGAPAARRTPSVVVKAAKQSLDDLEFEKEVLAEMRAAMEIARREGRSVHAWYSELPLELKLILDKDLSPSEKSEIASKMDAFLTVNPAKPAWPAKALQTESGAATCRASASGSSTSSSSGGGGGGGKPTADAGFSALEIEVDLMPKTRAELKKERRRAEQAVRAGGPAALLLNEEEERLEEEQLEKQLSMAHSTATLKKAAPAKKLKRLSVEEIDNMKLKALRRALEERGERYSEWEGKPDEIKQLRTYAKSLRSVCLTATQSKKMMVMMPDKEEGWLFNIVEKGANMLFGEAGGKEATGGREGDERDERDEKRSERRAKIKQLKQQKEEEKFEKQFSAETKKTLRAAKEKAEKVAAE